MLGKARLLGDLSVGKKRVLGEQQRELGALDVAVAGLGLASDAACERQLLIGKDGNPEGK